MTPHGSDLLSFGRCMLDNRFCFMEKNLCQQKGEALKYAN